MDVPKAEWKLGPWHDEPDRLEWRSPSGLPTLIVRSSVTGSLCGYAGVPPGHPLYEVPASDCGFHFKAADCRRVSWHRYHRSMRIGQRYLWRRYGGPEEPRGYNLFTRMDPDPHHAHTECDGHSPEDVLSCHGGITFSGGCGGPICHTPASGEPEHIWWFGFDCGHTGDVTPGMDALLDKIGSLWSDGDHHRGDEYRDLAYVQAEANQLAEQLAKFKGRIYCQRCHRRRRLKQLYCRCGSTGAWRCA